MNFTCKLLTDRETDRHRQTPCKAKHNLIGGVNDINLGLECGGRGEYSGGCYTPATAAAAAADNEGDDVDCPWLAWLAGERVV